MSGKIRSFFLSLTIITVLVFSAVGTTSVYADDDDTASDTATTETSGGGGQSDEAVTQTNGGGSESDEEAVDSGSSGEGSEEGVTEPQPTEIVEIVASTGDSTTTDTITVDPGSAGTDTGASGVDSQITAEPVVAAAVDETATPEEKSILEQVPENTTVTVLNADGQPQPLATQDAANAIVTSDPFWCPAGQGSTPGTGDCTASFTSFDLLLTELSSGNPKYQGAGTIFIQQNAYLGGESVIDFNSYNLSNISNSDLTVQGGWNPATNTVDLASTSNFTVPIIIGSSLNPWGGSLTINNIVITNPNQTGLTAYSQGNINLTNVQISGSVTGSGAELTAGGDVNIINSNFERNRRAGAIVNAGGDVTVRNSSFSNAGTNRLQVTGLDINSGGSVSLFDVIANGNREVGANIVANGRVAIGSSFIGGSSFSGTTGMTTTTCPGGGGAFCGFGLQIVTPDSIDLQGIIANDNFLWGASLNAGQDVNIVDSIFNANTTSSPAFIDDTGLLVTSGGNVALTNVQANNNRLIGAVIDAVGTVSIDSSTFSNNTGTTISGGVTTFHGYGLQVTSLDSIFISNVTASNNTLFGAHLDAAGDVIITDSFFNNNTTGSATDALGRGLEVISGQSVFIATVTLDGNQLFGANIQAPGDVFLDFMTVTNNGTDGIVSKASCTSLTDGTYSGNGQYGLSLVNPALDLTSAPTFSGNGAGDIFPTTPGACPVAPVAGNTGGNNTATIGSSNARTTRDPQVASLMSLNTNGFSGKAGLNKAGNFSLSSLFANSNPLFGASFQVAGNATPVKIGIFTGNYAFVYSARGIQIISLEPLFLSAGA